MAVRPLQDHGGRTSAEETDETTQEEGLPPQTRAAVANQVSDELCTQREDVAPTVEVVVRGEQATGLPADFAERTEALLEVQDVLPETRRHRRCGGG